MSSDKGPNQHTHTSQSGAEIQPIRLPSHVRRQQQSGIGNTLPGLQARKSRRGRKTAQGRVRRQVSELPVFDINRVRKDLIGDVRK